ncbi:RagB/SusD family nutrient uptake outer membrane protein [Chitinophaga ginsengisoli]|uniref:Putative outer membrane starch-binding protein n=1 Tax=Chitinophaga ginsengisoli TaxID=363837 RepID=A0A2P8G2Q1_9BACT|nr:RagB/SusD family nutrient uptake outer membrane protein [Chitinophaga ginsengisoli]PSL28216.1 putative outer membrane starch-binding protein [Chitinophaga ginsengisoli]
MITIKHCGLIALLGISLTACNKNSLEISPRDRVGDDIVWSSAANADLFLNDVYNSLPDMNNETEHLDQYTDNSDVGVTWMQGYANIRVGNVTPSNLPRGPWDMWYWGKTDNNDGRTGNYEKIRKCNLFIEKVTASNLPDDYKTKRIAEARFLRAMFYHWLWMAYGGVPVITRTLDNITQGDSIYVPRSTEEATFQFVTNELAEIATILPPNQSEPGRPTKGAALTLKGWCELYEASPLRNSGNAANPGGDLEKWKKAAATNKAVMDLGVYDLYPDFRTLFLKTANNSRESIFARQYMPGKGGQLEGKEGPTIVNGTEVAWGNFQPTQELVDEFSMANGKAIGESGSGYDPQHPYVNREKRFYQTILFNGSPWQGDTIRTVVGLGRSTENEIDLGYSSDVTHTGYYACKRLDESILGSDNRANSTSYQNYMFFRYAEVLLSFAEAENEVNGPTADVLAAVNKVRTRNNNLPTVEATYGAVDKDKMRAIIRRERRVELAFEDKRWWDVLRWKIADKMADGTPGVLNRPELGMVITSNNGTLVYTRTNVSTRLFLPKMYYMPIPQNVLDRNYKIRAQNGGKDAWVNGQNPGY